ncbi:MAG: hypothetical protein ACRBBS_00970 [Thalassovita sp.]
MNVTEISVCRLPGTTADGGIRGIVTIQTDRKRNHILQCHVPAPGPKGARAALIADALRQLSRMPEHRRLRVAG